MNFVNLNASPVKTRNWYKGLFLLGMVFCLGMANAANYYLTSAGASTASTAGSWNTNPAGGGTALSSWTTASTTDTYIIPVGISGTWSASIFIGNSGSGSQSYTFVIDGSLTMPNNIVITFQGSNNNVTWTTNGTLTINEEGGDESFNSNSFGTAYFKFSSGATLISNNASGISGTNNSIFGNNNDFRFLHNQGANYTFLNTANTTTTNGLNDTLNNLTISTTGSTCNTAGALAVKGTLTITGGTFTLAQNTTVEDSVSITGGTLAIGSRTFTLIAGSTFNHSAGSVTISTGDLVINGMFTFSLGAFSISSSGDVQIGSTGTLALNSGVFNMLARTLTCAGTITRTSGSIYFSSGSGGITFTNATPKTLPSDVFLRYPLTFIINGSGGVTLGGNTRTQTDTLSTLTLTSGILNLSTGKTAVSTLSRTSGSISGNTSANLIFYGSGTKTLVMDQTTPGTTNELGEITLNGTTDLTLGSNLVIETSLTINSRTVNLSTFTLTKNGNYTKSTGTITLSTGDFIVTGLYEHTSSGALTFSSGSFMSVGSLTLTSGGINISSGKLSIGGTVSRTNGTINGQTGTVEFINTSPITLPINTFIDYPSAFTLNGVGGVTLGSNNRSSTDSLGTLTMTSGNLTLSSASILIDKITGLGGNIVGNITSRLVFYGSNTNTLLMDQTTPGTTNAVNELILDGTSNLTLGSNVDVKSQITLNSQTLNLGSFTLTKTGTFTNGSAGIQLNAGTLSITGEYTNVSTRPVRFDSGTLSVGSMVMTSGEINVSKGILRIGGTITRNGTTQTGQISAPGGTVIFTNTSPITLPNNTFARYPANFTVNGSGGVTLGGTTSGALTDSLGLLTMTSGNLTLTSRTTVVGSMVMTSGIINVSTGTLSIGGAVSRTSGQINARVGTVRFTNGSAVTLPNGTFSHYPSSFVLNGAGGVTLGGRNGSPSTDSLYALTLTSGNLTLRPGTFTTAIGSITGSGGNIVGNATATLVFFGSTTNTLLMNQTTAGTTNAVSVLTLNGTSNLTLGSNLDVKTTLTINARTLNLGSFTLTKTGTFTNGTATVQLSTGTLSVSGAYTHISTGTVTFGSGTLAVGSLVMTSGNINVSTGTLSIGGAISRNGTTQTGQISAPVGTVRFTNTSAVTLPSNTFIRYPANFILNGAGGVTLGGITTGALTDSLRSLTMTSGNLTLRPGSFTTAIGSITGSGGNIVGNATATLVFFGSSTSTLLMNQTTPGTTNAVSVLTLNGTSNVTLGSNLDVKTTLTLNLRTLNLGSFTLTKTGTFTNGTATVQLSSGAFNISGAYTHVNTGTLTFGSGTLAVGSLVMTSGNINVSSGTLSIAGAVSRNGTTQTGQIHAPNGTVRFTNTTSVTLPSNTFVTYPVNLTLNGAGGVTLGGKTGTLKDSLGNLTFTSGNLTITTDTTCIGSITGSGGSIVGNTSSTVRFYGSNSSTLRTSQTTPGTSNAVKNLLFTGSSNVTLGTATRIAANGLVNIPSSTTLNTGGLLTIVSNATGHGRVGTVGGTFTSSSTDSIQLFIPGGERGYRLFGNPFTSALAISQFMDNATEIDVTGAGGSGNGFTNTINNNPSAYSYNTTGNSWSAFTSTSQTIGIGAGAHILVRGVKGEGLNGAVYTPKASTIRLAGQFRTGNVVTNLSDAGFGWNLVANPYPSNIDINQISGGNWVNVNAAIYGYDKVNRTYSAYSKNVGNAVNNLSNIIEMGSSFLAEVTTTGSASITFTEAIKTSASSTVGGNSIFTPKEERLNQFKINLSGAEGSEGFFQDECLLSFGNSSISTPEFDSQSDAWDLGGEMLNVGIITPKNDYLAINEYPSIEKQTDAIPLNVWSKNNGEYSLSLTEVSPINENTEIWLRDKYKGEVHFIQESPYKFDINDMEESYGANRFELFIVQQSSGLSKTSTKNTLRVFPNPVDINAGKVSIYIPGEGHEYVKTTIYDLSGREVYSSKKVKYETMQTIDLTLPTELSAQTYIMSCETLQGTFVQQIIINNK